ncbi:MAG: ABC transporter permease [Acidobacteria bacterium]|nr:ABC transporter permease [Acidobacteriota bacterium]
MTQRWEVTPRYPGAGATLVEVWQYRRLMGFIGDRALRKQYRRTVLGWLWLFINPLFPIALRAVIFGALLGVGSNGLPYFLFLLAGTVIWDVFATSLNWGTRALEMNRDLTSQIYHPRALLTIGNMTPAFLNLGLKVGVFALALAYYSIRDGRGYLRGDWSMLWALAALVLAFLLSLAFSMFTSIWGERLRDIRFGLGQLLSVWYLLTPVLYPLSQVPPEHRDWMLLNPLAIIVETFKWGLFGVGEFYPNALGGTAAGVVLLLTGGLIYFARTEARTIAER